MKKQDFLDAVEKAKDLIFENDEVKRVWNDLKSITSLADGLETPKHIRFLIMRVIEAIEIVEQEYQKFTPEERIDIAAQILDDLIKFKGWASVFEAFDDQIFKFIIGFIYAELEEKFFSEPEKGSQEEDKPEIE